MLRHRDTCVSCTAYTMSIRACYAIVTISRHNDSLTQFNLFVYYYNYIVEWFRRRKKNAGYRLRSNSLTVSKSKDFQKKILQEYKHRTWIKKIWIWITSMKKKRWYGNLDFFFLRNHSVTFAFLCVLKFNRVSYVCEIAISGLRVQRLTLTSPDRNIPVKYINIYWVYIFNT